MFHLELVRIFGTFCIILSDTHMALRRARRSPVWTPMEKADPGTVTCLLCEYTLKFCGSITSLTKHLSAKHPGEYAEIKEEKGHKVEPARKLSRKEFMLHPTVSAMVKKKTC